LGLDNVGLERVGVVTDVVAAGSAERRMGVDKRQKPILGVRSLMIGGVREKPWRRFVANVVKHGTPGQSRGLTPVVDAHHLIPLRTLRSL